MIRERIKQEIKEQGNRLMLKEDIPIEHKVVSVSNKHKEVTIRIKSGKEIVVPIKKYGGVRRNKRHLQSFLLSNKKNTMTDEIKINPAEKITELKKERDVINKKEQELRKMLNQITTHKIQIEGQIRMMEGFLPTKTPVGGKTAMEQNPSEKK